MPPVKVFIQIVNFNGGEDILKCLKSLKLLAGKKEVVVIDNASTDNSLLRIKRLFPKLYILENKTNLGFAGGHNRGLRYSLDKGATHILILNPDIVVSDRRFFEKILGNCADITAPLICFRRRGRKVYDFGGKVNFCLGRPWHLETTSRRKIKASAVDYVSGACMLVQRRVFEKIGLFDRRFFMYFEDVDFCIRAKNKGFKISVEDGTAVLHKLKEINQRGQKAIYLIKSNLLFINKHIPWKARPAAYLYWLLLTCKLLWKR